MSFESGNAQRNTTLDRLKQRTPPTLTDQQPSVLYTMPMTTVERLEEVLRRTLTLQETIRADTERLATKENLRWELYDLDSHFRQNGAVASARFQGKILLTILASGIVSAMVSVLMWRVLL